jgi:hypothetical protein
MHRLLFVAVVALSACAPRAIKIPNVAVPPTAVSFEQGVNARTKLLEYEIPEVKLATQKTQGMSINLPWGHSIGNAKQQQQRSFVVRRGANPELSVDCETRQEGKRIASMEFSKHTYKCSAPGFELVVDEARKSVFAGSVRVGEVELELESTDQMLSGIPMRPSGFHIRRNGRWIASFEYYQFGKAYLGADMTADERDAVLVAMVSIQSTNHWLARSIAQNQSRAFGL